MKRTLPEKPKFAAVKHYHRQTTARRRVGWDEWAETNPNRKRYPWGKIILAILSLLALGGIITGLAIELAPA